MRPIAGEWDNPVAVSSLSPPLATSENRPFPRLMRRWWALSSARRDAWLGSLLVLMLSSCGGEDRTIETIPIPASVDTCLDELQATGEAETVFGVPDEGVQLCVVLQGLDCVLNEPLCAGGADCPAPSWSCSNPGLELESGDTVDAYLFLVEDEDATTACSAVEFGDTPTCSGADCLARIEYELEYAGGDGLLVSESAPVRISHSGFLSEEVGSFGSAPASICGAITEFMCEGPGCETPTRINLTVGGIGSGRIDIQSEARSFVCDTPRCTVFLPSGRTATFTATATTGSVFGDWGDACSSEQRTPSCTLSPTGETVVSARFAHRLQVVVLGEGTVRSSDAGLDGDGVDCVSTPAGMSCPEDYVTDRRVLLTATGSLDWPFSSWEGCDSVDGETCTVTMDRAHEVRATFGRQVAVEVVGGGSVTVNPGQRVCAGQCAFAFTPGESVTVEATADTGSTRYDWLGDCESETGDTCALGAVDRNFALTARFGYDVTTTFDAATGDVDRNESEASIACSTGSGDCRSFLPGTQVTYTAVAGSSPAYGFSGWQGLCSSAGSNVACNLTIGGAGSVQATFERAVQVGVQLINNGQANGTVAASPQPNAAGCSVDCSDRYWLSTGQVDLTANAPTGTRFVGWSRVGGGNACEGSDSSASCRVNIADAQDRVLEARFVSDQVVTVTFRGEGTGTITPDADPPSPNWTCSATQCSGEFAAGQTVTFDANTTGINHLETFRSLEPNCDGGTTCTVVIGSLDITIAAEFEVEREFRLTFAGGGDGTVVLPPSFEQANSLTCTANCSRVYLSGREFELTATPDPDNVFDRWQPTCSGTVPNGCQVTMDADPKLLTVRFEPPRTLDLELLGSGTANIDIGGLGNPAGCSGAVPQVCPTFNFPSGSTATLTVQPTAGTNFVQWGGDCAGTVGTVCTLDMTANRSVTATFEQRTADITVAFGGDAAASGLVRWVSPSRNDCNGPTACTETVNEGTSVVLQAVDGAGYQFQQWTGCDSPSGNDCTLTASSDRTVTADFTALNGVTVAVNGSGRGRINWSNPSRPPCEVNAPSTCPTEFVVQNQDVTLQAVAADADTELVGWTSGCDSVSGNDCILNNVTAAETPAAEFAALHDITITLAGDGGGRVVWTDPSTFPDCIPGTCAPQRVREGTTVVLTAQTVAGSEFNGWSGCDTVTGTNNEICTLNSVSADRTPVASYFLDRTIAVSMLGTGAAGIEFRVGGVVVESCDPSTTLEYSCVGTFSYSAGTVTLTAVEGAGTTFQGWANGCTGTGTCLVDIQPTVNHIREATFSN